jgi:hypothetical protein
VKYGFLLKISFEVGGFQKPSTMELDNLLITSSDLHHAAHLLSSFPKADSQGSTSLTPIDYFSVNQGVPTLIFTPFTLYKHANL